MKKFFNEFKEFATRGNVVDTAVGFVIGAAFRAIVDSFITNIISPIFGLFMDDSLSGLSIVVGNATITYGAFLEAIINFITIAFILFVVIKIMNKLRRKRETEEVVVEPSDEIKLLTEIRDALKK